MWIRWIQQLMSSDKYHYSKTKTRKEAELAGVESREKL